MKKSSTYIRILFLALSVALFAHCGMQVRRDPNALTSGANPDIAGPSSEALYTVGGSAWKVKEPVPAAYSNNAPDGIVLTINDEELPIHQDGSFTFSQKFKSGEAYNVGILHNGIPIEANNGLSFIYLNCDISKGSGVIANANVTNVFVACHLDDIPYPS